MLSPATSHPSLVGMASKRSVLPATASVVAPLDHRRGVSVGAPVVSAVATPEGETFQTNEGGSSRSLWSAPWLWAGL